MANVIINDTNLKNIGNAIREKNGGEILYKPSEMADAILAIEGGGGGGYEPTEEDLTYNIYNGSPFANGSNYWVLREYGNDITLTNNNSNGNIFVAYPGEVFDKNIKYESTMIFLQNYLSGSTTLKSITGSLVIPDGISTQEVAIQRMDMMFSGDENLREINDNYFDSNKYYWFNRTGTNYCRAQGIFNYCYSLREIPQFYYDVLTRKGQQRVKINSASYFYNSLFQACATLNKVENLPVVESLNSGSSITSNMFTNAFLYCHNLHKLTFQTNADGTPMTAKWTNQIIDLTDGGGSTTKVDDVMVCSIGVGIGGSYTSFMYNYNSGLLQADRISDTNSQYYVGDGLTKYWNNDFRYSKYGHTEAVETINSLPDTSAAGGSNTIKFTGYSGLYTDYLKGRTSDKTFNSRINTLTDAEIAVATAKGWTVTLV